MTDDGEGVGAGTPVEGGADGAPADVEERGEGGDGGSDGDSHGGGEGDDERVGTEGGTEEGYVHRPAGSARPHQAPPSESDFGWRGWLLVGVLVVALLVVPTAILYLPEAQGFVTSLGLSLRDTYLVLPLVPAFLLGAIAVWAAVRSRT